MRNIVGQRRVLAGGRVIVERHKRDRGLEATYTYRFTGFEPFMGTSFDFIAHTATRSVNYVTGDRYYTDYGKGRIRARKLLDAVKNNDTAEAGLMRKPRKNPSPKIRVNTPRRPGANRFSLRNALENRARSVPGYGDAASCLAVLYPRVELKRASADQLFDTLYALAWAQAWGRNLNDWQGMSVEVAV